jgi:hypothetical protein
MGINIVSIIRGVCNSTIKNYVNNREYGTPLKKIFYSFIYFYAFIRGRALKHELAVPGYICF